MYVKDKKVKDICLVSGVKGELSAVLVIFLVTPKTQSTVSDQTSESCSSNEI